MNRSSHFVGYVKRVDERFYGMDERIKNLEKKVAIPLLSVHDLQFVVNIISHERSRSQPLRDMLKEAPVDAKNMDTLNSYTVDVSAADGDLLLCDKFFLYQVAITFCKEQMLEDARVRDAMQQDLDKVNVTNKRLRDERDDVLNNSRKTKTKVDLTDVKSATRVNLCTLRDDYKIRDGDPLGQRLIHYTRTIFKDVEDELNGK